MSESARTWPTGTRLFDRLPLPVKQGDVVRLSNGQRAIVETVHLADDLRDAKCTAVVIGEARARGAA